MTPSDFNAFLRWALPLWIIVVIAGGVLFSRKKGEK